MAHFVLVHGAWQGAWVWQAVTAGLVMRGHDVCTFDLPGSGTNRTPLAEVTLAGYAARIAAAVRAAGNPVTLVGHGMGGMACAAAAELVPDHLARLLYLCAFAPRDGDTLSGLLTLSPKYPLPPTQGTAAGLALSIPREFRVASFMHDAPAPVAHWAAAQFREQALAPFGEPVRLTPARYGQVASSYVVCTEDRLLAPAMQRQMADRTGCSRILALPASHSPFLSDPWCVAQTLHRLATEN
jgi:pimeloyl-ACP methyl ester carboxylesterase